MGKVFQKNFGNQKKETQKNHPNGKKFKIVSSHANISNTPFDQRSPQPPGEGVLNYHRQTHRQTDMATL